MLKNSLKYRDILIGFTLTLGVSAIILIIPQINANQYVFPTVVSKFIYFLYFILFLSCIYIVGSILSNTSIFSFSGIDIALFLLVLYITVNRYLIQSQHGFSIRYIELLGLFFLYVTLRRIKQKDYIILLLAIIASGIIQMMYGYLQLAGYCLSNHSGFKMTGSFFNPGPYAGFLVSVFVISLGIYLFRDKIIAIEQLNYGRRSALTKKISKYIYDYLPLAGIIGIAIILPALQSRASWMAAVLGSLVLFEVRYNIFRKFFKKSNVIKKVTLTMLFLVIVGSGFLGIYLFKKESSEGRAFIWKVTTQIIRDYPIFGVGFDGFNSHYMNYQADYFANNVDATVSKLADNTYYAFNEELQFQAENGAFGSILLFTLFIVLLKTKSKENFSVLVIIAKMGLLTTAIFSLFSYPLQILPIEIIVVILLALISDSAINTFTFNIGKSDKTRLFYKIPFVLLSLTFIYRGFSYTKALNEGFLNWATALQTRNEDRRSAILEFESSYQVFARNAPFLLNYGETLVSAGEFPKGIRLLEQSRNFQNNTNVADALGNSYKTIKKYKNAEACYQNAINMSPNKFYSSYLLAKLYKETGQANKAVTMANQIINKESKIPSTAIDEIKLEMKNILSRFKKLDVPEIEHKKTN